MLQPLLGAVRFFKKFILNFAVNVEPLFHLLKKFDWGINSEKGFEYVRKESQNPKSLTQPNFSKRFILYTDASNNAVGFILMQKHDNELKPVAHGRRVLTEVEYC